MAELQVIPARHGVATFVPAGQIIKIINTSGTQVIDAWAFALPKPEEKGSNEQKKEEKSDSKNEQPQKDDKSAAKQTPKKKKDSALPSQEDAEKATKEVFKEGEHTNGGDATEASKTPQKSTWSSYVPTLGLTSSSNKAADAPKKEETEQQKDSRTWASYFPSGKGFSTYIPKSASSTVSSFAKDFQRDPNKSYVEQLQDFSKTPVGAAGMAALTGSGYGGSLYAGYQAWNASNAADVPPMEFLSMPHSRTATLHLQPRVNDTLVSNVREPMLTVVEDTSPGIHDTLIAACDPYRYKNLGVKDWEKHGSCAENLVMALKELNERAGLKGAKGVGAEVTLNSVPAPLNLFMNIPWDEDGDLGFKAPKGKPEDFIRLKAERDVVVVMSACPNDVQEINGKKSSDAHFIVEEDNATDAIKRSQPAKKQSAPKKINSSAKAPSTAGGADGADSEAPTKKPVPARRTVPQKKPTGATGTNQPAPKKPAPKPAQQSKPAGDADGTSAAPAEKKKPRKLTPKPKPEA